ncbi:hypothetical protein PMIN03_008911 [Paraphaeosphaeria minitans]
MTLPEYVPKAQENICGVAQHVGSADREDAIQADGKHLNGLFEPSLPLTNISIFVTVKA